MGAGLRSGYALLGAPPSSPNLPMPDLRHLIAQCPRHGQPGGPIRSVVESTAMGKVFVLYLFLRGTQVAAGPAIEIVEFPTLAECRGAADAAMMISDEEPREWQPFVAQWACVPRYARLANR